ncbi:hypothetical protein NB231_13766 [Nitrococcus mobilis Nb-231]|uniref:Uncharacterized protein n=1 Tax=Nitrococcus mobilis Nb-231 TaxID=314278 RepID=A4BVR2_9GAMM|nr:hypothetical protein NB231_13766 [Nitrococcus mobilis Nb-231]
MRRDHKVGTDIHLGEVSQIVVLGVWHHDLILRLETLAAPHQVQPKLANLLHDGEDVPEAWLVTQYSVEITDLKLRLLQGPQSNHPGRPDAEATGGIVTL